MLQVASRIENGGRGEDRVVTKRTDTGFLIVVADGAGGTGGGAAAAQAVCDGAIAVFEDAEPTSWAQHLRSLDALLATVGTGGLSTAVVLHIDGTMVAGASVGDSGAWLISDGEVIDLTERQVRKPLLGTGKAEPVSIGPFQLIGRLLVGTDGLFKYAPQARLVEAAQRGSVEDA